MSIGFRLTRIPRFIRFANPFYHFLVKDLILKATFPAFSSNSIFFSLHHLSPDLTYISMFSFDLLSTSLWEEGLDECQVGPIFDDQLKITAYVLGRIVFLLLWSMASYSLTQ